MDQWFFYLVFLLMGIFFGALIKDKEQKVKSKLLNNKCSGLIKKIRDRISIKVGASSTDSENCETFLSDMADKINKDSRLQMLFQFVFKNINDGVVVLNEKSDIELLNPPLLTILGAPGHVEDWLFRPLFELLRNSSIINAVNNIHSGESQEETLPFSHNNKELLAKIRPSGSFSNNEKEKSVILVITNLTPNIRSIQAEKDLVANVAHQLRTPLTSIKGYAETLLDEDMHDPELSRQFLETILRNADKLTRLVRDILLLAKLDSKEAEASRKEEVISECIRHVIDSVSNLAKKKGIELIADIPKKNISHKVNAQDMEQAIINLVDNAIKYSPKNGRVKIGLEDREKDILIYVADNGPGLPSESLDKVFERFYRLTRDNKPGFKGTGLGLAIVKQIVENHGGSVWVESRMGKGSTFFISLPKT